jgi:sialic acid synthase SpsE
MSEYPFIIAEAGSNWRCGTPARDLQMAKNLIEAAADAKASAVKFQVYRAKSVYVENAGSFKEHCGQDLEDISKTFEDLEMPYALIETLSRYCAQCGIEFMATPFSIEDFQAVNPFVKMHKMASYEMEHIRLWEHMIRSGKPVFFSTGGFTLPRIDKMVEWLQRHDAKLDKFTVMHCVASYPAELNSLGLGVIATMAAKYKKFGLKVGYSDHSLDPVTAPSAAIALGAHSIEKHFTLNRHLPGPDHPFAIEVHELKAMVSACRKTFEAVRENAEKGHSAAELKLQDFAHRGLQAISNIKRGDKLQENKNFAILRPGNNPKGTSPLDVEKIESKLSKLDIPLGHGIRLENVE